MYPSLLFLLVPFAHASRHAVLVAGSAGWSNYRHQADICHAQAVLRRGGVQSIITMMFDDVASAPVNPFPGKLFNAPSNRTAPGVDVYEDCTVDYRGENVTTEYFLQVLLGNAENVPQGHPVLVSNASAHLFINYFNIIFPNLFQKIIHARLRQDG